MPQLNKTPILKTITSSTITQKEDDVTQVFRFYSFSLIIGLTYEKDVGKWIRLQ